jgi:hypothetical protein
MAIEPTQKGCFRDDFRQVFRRVSRLKYHGVHRAFPMLRGRPLRKIGGEHEIVDRTGQNCVGLMLAALHLDDAVIVGARYCLNPARGAHLRHKRVIKRGAYFKVSRLGANADRVNQIKTADQGFLVDPPKQSVGMGVVDQSEIDDVCGGGRVQIGQ